VKTIIFFFIPKEAILKFSWHRTNKIELGVYKYVIKDSDDSLIVYWQKQDGNITVSKINLYDKETKKEETLYLFTP